ncbi:MAG: DUF4062 domain-containing protein [Anaerolineales bacterium]
MAQKKKLQVFISSTYSDLHEERQAAVEAILTAGHIPAGMELFAAGDESQMTAIKRWIDESDVYMLILGGRYGSIEPKSQKSYIELEYQYAVEKGKPLFAVVINEDYLEKKVKKFGSSVIEKDHPDKLKEFRSLVCSKMVRFWSDPKDIKLAIMETMADFSNREELAGWIPSNEGINTGMVAEEIAGLIKENKELREKLSGISANSVTYNGLLFEEMYSLLLSTDVNSKNNSQAFITSAEELARTLGDSEPKLFHYFLLITKLLQRGSIRHYTEMIQNLIEFGLIKWESGTDEDYPEGEYTYAILSESGMQFLLRLRLKGIIAKAEPYIIDKIRIDINK